MALFVLRTHILQTRMRSHPVELHVCFLVGLFVYFNTLYVRTAKALARLRRCTGSPEPSLFAYLISTIISWAGSIIMSFHGLADLKRQIICPLTGNLPFHRFLGPATWRVSFFSYMSRLMTKPTKWHRRPAETQISLGIRRVWSESSLSAWRNLGSLAAHRAHSEDSDQTRRMPRLSWVFARRTVILLVLLWGGSYVHVFSFAFSILLSCVSLSSSKSSCLESGAKYHLGFVHLCICFIYSNCHFVCLFLLEFYGPVNNEVMSSRSLNSGTVLLAGLDRLSG